MTLALLGSIDSLLTSLVADSMTKTKHKPNKDLLPKELELYLFFFGAIPGAGATMRTVINIKSGGTTRVSGIVHSITLLYCFVLTARIPAVYLEF
ncbi:MAG: SulP family inorganic anion transporter [Halarcobacter ebronensis]